MNDPKYKEIDDRTRIELSLPDFRRSRLKRVLDCKGLITAMEAHSGIFIGRTRSRRRVFRYAVSAGKHEQELQDNGFRCVCY